MSATPEELAAQQAARDKEVRRLVRLALEDFYVALDALIEHEEVAYAEVRNDLFTLDAEEIAEDYADWRDDE